MLYCINYIVQGGPIKCPVVKDVPYETACRIAGEEATQEKRLCRKVNMANTTFHVSGFGGHDTICSTEWHVKPKWINVSTLSSSSSSLTKGPMPVGARCRSRY